MLLAACHARLQRLVAHQSWEIATPDAEGIGLQTTIQLDGDVVMRLTPAALQQPTLCQAHLAQIQRVLTALRWLRRLLTWGSAVGAMALSLPMATTLWKYTQLPVWHVCAGTLLGAWLGKRGLEYLGRLYFQRLLRQAARGGVAQNRG